jgi:hypothetical protein
MTELKQVLKDTRNWIEKWLLNVDPVSTTEIEQKMRSKMNYGWLSHYSASELRDLIVEMATSSDMAQVDKIIDDWQCHSKIQQNIMKQEEKIDK